MSKQIINHYDITIKELKNFRDIVNIEIERLEKIDALTTRPERKRKNIAKIVDNLLDELIGLIPDDDRARTLNDKYYECLAPSNQKMI
jgi:hypothetical protein